MPLLEKRLQHWQWQQRPFTWYKKTFKLSFQLFLVQHLTLDRILTRFKFNFSQVKFVFFLSFAFCCLPWNSQKEPAKYIDQSARCMSRNRHCMAFPRCQVPNLLILPIERIWFWAFYQWIRHETCFFLFFLEILRNLAITLITILVLSLGIIKSWQGSAHLASLKSSCWQLTLNEKMMISASSQKT